MADDKVEILDDDKPVPLEPSLPPEIASPLAPFAGAKPPAPKWFEEAIAQAPERRLVPVLGANIELLTWGQVGKPGLIFVHGNSAHADWWSFICPWFANDWRVASISFSGMGGSDWREAYAFETFASEIYECARAAGLYENGQKPIYVGHSFGGSQVYYSAARYPERMRGALLVDTGFGGPPTEAQMEAMRKEMEEQARKTGQPMPSMQGWGRGGPNQSGRPNRVYATQEEALSRFRFMPPQVPGNLYVADFIARNSLKRAPMADGSGEGWTWKFDPGFWSKLDRSAMNEVSNERAAPMAHIYGDQSNIMKRHPGASGSSMIPADAPHIVIPDSEHHIMVDQPLALVAAIRALLTFWPEGRSTPKA
jgi:pimeloyl-ACP methyl ester carboxylesterase